MQHVDAGKMTRQQEGLSPMEIPDHVTSFGIENPSRFCPDNHYYLNMWKENENKYIICKYALHGGCKPTLPILSKSK